jgi:hypothetical protein
MCSLLLDYQRLYKLLDIFFKEEKLIHCLVDLMDYPDSEEETTQGGEAVINPNILDIDDAEMADAEAPKPAGTAAATMTPARAGSTDTAARRQPASGDQPNTKEKFSDGAYNTKKRQTSTVSECSAHDGPDLPPIYLTVRKEREKRLVARNLYGCGYTGAESTPLSAHLSPLLRLLDPFPTPVIKGITIHSSSMTSKIFATSARLLTPAH